MKLSDILASLPPVKSVAGVQENVRKQLKASGRHLVVVDDDPTGTQTVHGVMVYTDWSIEQLCQALSSEEPVFYISTNSRSLQQEQAERLNYQLGRDLAEAAKLQKKEVIIASRSDSTLRGHFPHEVEALLSGLGGEEVDGIILVPAFFEGGRYTINDIHWVDEGERIVSAEKTEFARDPVFGYKHGNLRLWVEEKTGGKVKAGEVYSISIETIRRGGPEAVTEELMHVSGRKPVIINAACYQDLEVFVLGLLSAESKGKRFIYRCAASFVKARGGFPDKSLLTYQELSPEKGPGLVVVGSYVEKTSRQLDCLLNAHLGVGVELRVEKLLEAGERNSEIQFVAGEVNKQLSRGELVAIYTSRNKKMDSEKHFLEIGKVIMSSLCRVLEQVRIQPGFLVAKGGITSIEIARSALGVKKSLVLGQIVPGVPVWRLGAESRWPGIPYVVFPGNVGNERTLSQVVMVFKNKKGGISNE